MCQPFYTDSLTKEMSVLIFLYSKENNLAKGIQAARCPVEM